MPLKLTLATPTDIPSITTLWYNAFSPSMLPYFPNTPSMHTWWNETNTHAMLHNPTQIYLKVIDTDNGDRIAAYAKWDFQSAEKRGARFPAWGRDQDRALCDEFFEPLESARRRVVGGRENFYLDMLATHSDYRFQGAARLLVNWGCAEADKAGVPTYIDASEDGRQVYEKFGFEDRSDARMKAQGLTAMVREPRLRN